MKRYPRIVRIAAALIVLPVIFIALGIEDMIFRARGKRKQPMGVFER